MNVIHWAIFIFIHSRRNTITFFPPLKKWVQTWTPTPTPTPLFLISSSSIHRKFLSLIFFKNSGGDCICLFYILYKQRLKRLDQSYISSCCSLFVLTFKKTPAFQPSSSGRYFRSWFRCKWKHNGTVGEVNLWYTGVVSRKSKNGLHQFSSAGPSKT